MGCRQADNNDRLLKEVQLTWQYLKNATITKMHFQYPQINIITETYYQTV